MDEKRIDEIASNDYLFKKSLLEMQFHQSSEIKEIRTEIKGIKKSVSGIKITVAGFGSVFGLIGAYLKSKLGGN